MTRIHIISAPTRPKPQAGDRRITKKHGLQIRVQCMAVWCRRPVSRLVSNGRPVFSRVKPEHLEFWDRHHLTPEERERFFPEVVHGCGHMQGRGAA